MTKDSILQSLEIKKHLTEHGSIKLPKGIGDVRPQTKASKYTDITKAHQSFNGIRFIEAIGGLIVLRGKEGQRDMLYPLDRAVKTFFRMGLFYERLKKNAPLIVTLFKDVLKDFGAKIIEAAKMRSSLNLPLPPNLTPLKLLKIKLYLATDLGSIG